MSASHGWPVTTVRTEFVDGLADYDVGGAANSPELWADPNPNSAEHCSHHRWNEVTAAA